MSKTLVLHGEMKCRNTELCITLKKELRHYLVSKNEVIFCKQYSSFTLCEALYYYLERIVLLYSIVNIALCKRIFHYSGRKINYFSF
jgi:hypothetical protein